MDDKEILKYLIKRTLLETAIGVPVTAICCGLSAPFVLGSFKKTPAKLIAGLIAVFGSAGIGTAAGIKLGDIMLEEFNPVKLEEFKKLKKEAFKN